MQCNANWFKYKFTDFANTMFLLVKIVKNYWSSWACYIVQNKAFLTQIIFSKCVIRSLSVIRCGFLQVLKQETTKVWLSALDIDTSHPEGLFSLMDLNGDGIITLEEFMNVANAVRGPAQTVDLFYLQNHVEPSAGPFHYKKNWCTIQI